LYDNNEAKSRISDISNGIVLTHGYFFGPSG